MRWFCLFLLFVNFSLFGSGSPLVFVHIGDKLPSYLEISLTQARLFNKTSPIILIANERALQNYEGPLDVEMITCESLRPTPEHERFCLRTTLSATVGGGFWLYTSERFLYLYDYMVAYGVSDVFHLENDVMLYADVEEMLPLFHAHYRGIATTFESERKAIPGFVYIPNAQVMQMLAASFAAYATKAISDMNVIAAFWRKEGDEIIDCLPMMTKTYFYDYPLHKEVIKKRLGHCKYVEEFHSIFDGAALGVFLDPSLSKKGNMKALFDPALCAYEWLEDSEHRMVPHICYKNEKYRINTLHIPSKNLNLFRSSFAGE